MRMPLLAATTTSLVLTLALAGCGSSEQTADPTPATAPTSSTTTETTAAPPVQQQERATKQHHGHASKTSRHQRKQAKQQLEKLRRKAAREDAPADNPLAGRTWATYRGDQDLAWEPFAHASGQQRSDLAAIAQTPKAKWFGYWIPGGDIADKVHDYVANATAGDPDALVQMTLFRMVPWEHDVCHRNPTAAEAASYRDWIDRFATALGDTHAAIVLQPDGPFALCAPGGPGAVAPLISYSAQKLSALPHTSVYVEAGASDWPADGQGGVSQVLRFLIADGVRYARGFALDSTHYSSTADNVERGAAIARALAAQGIPDKHFVVNTAMNGDPHLFGEDHGANPNYPPVCSSPSDPRPCVTLGIPPTPDVDNPRWGFSPDVDALAKQYADGYLWVGRPWLYHGATPFELDRALALVHSTPYRDLLPTS